MWGSQYDNTAGQGSRFLLIKSVGSNGDWQLNERPLPTPGMFCLYQGLDCFYWLALGGNSEVFAVEQVTMMYTIFKKKNATPRIPGTPFWALMQYPRLVISRVNLLKSYHSKKPKEINPGNQ